MEWQKYLPWIIGAAIVLYFLSKMQTRTLLAPQTQITQTPQADPYLEARTKAFGDLVSLAQTEAAQDTEKFKSVVGLTVSNKSFDTQASIAQIYSNAQNYAANLQLLQRNQDAQIQKSAIDRYYSSRNLDSITNSIALALGGIFGGGSNNNSVFKGTPPTFPGFTF